MKMGSSELLEVFGELRGPVSVGRAPAFHGGLAILCHDWENGKYPQGYFLIIVNCSQYLHLLFIHNAEVLN